MTRPSQTKDTHTHKIIIIIRIIIYMYWGTNLHHEKDPHNKNKTHTTKRSMTHKWQAGRLSWHVHWLAEPPLHGLPTVVLLCSSPPATSNTFEMSMSSPTASNWDCKAFDPLLLPLPPLTSLGCQCPCPTMSIANAGNCRPYTSQQLATPWEMVPPLARTGPRFYFQCLLELAPVSISNTPWN